jgi:hypothetical protein
MRSLSEWEMIPSQARSRFCEATKSSFGLDNSARIFQSRNNRAGLTGQSFRQSSQSTSLATRDSITWAVDDLRLIWTCKALARPHLCFDRSRARSSRCGVCILWHLTITSDAALFGHIHGNGFVVRDGFRFFASEGIKRR